MTSSPHDAKEHAIPTPQTSSPIADYVFLNASVFTDAVVTPAPDTVGVRGDTIVYVGHGVAPGLVGAATETIDVHGATLLPGFIDAHVHPVAAGMQALRCDLSGLAHDRRDYLGAIDGDARANPGGPVIAGSGWYGDAFAGGSPNRSDIDTVVPDRPVVLTSHDGHGVWVNTKALEVCGITSRTGDPSGGRIVRDESGQPTGMLIERAADPFNALI